MKISLKLFRAEDILAFFFVTLPLWRDYLFSRLPMGMLLINMVMCGLVFITIIKKRKLKKYWDIPVLYGVIFLLFFFKFFLNPQMNAWMTNDYGVGYMFVTAGIYGYIVMRLQSTPSRLIRTLKLAGFVLALYYAYKSLEVLRNGYWTYTLFGVIKHRVDNMSWSYGVLMAISFIGMDLVMEGKKYPLFFIIVGLWGILLYGSRGTVVSFVMGVLILILSSNHGRLSPWKLILIGLVGGAIAFVFSDVGVLTITRFVNTHGVYSRFLNSLIIKQTSDQLTSGRTLIWSECVKMILNGSPFGYGVMGERNMVYGLGTKFGYAHNIFLELLVAFGWLLGGIIILLMVCGIVMFYVQVKDKAERILFTVFLMLSFELLLSNTIWLHCGPWVLLALFVNHFKDHWQVGDNGRLSRPRRRRRFGSALAR